MSSTVVCDNKSVGIVVIQEEALQRQVLLIKRFKSPYGWAPPAGHVDLEKSELTEEDYKAAAQRELKEETGLRAIRLQLLLNERTVRSCRRNNGNYHYWRVYLAVWSGMLSINPAEAQDAKWFNQSELEELALLTERYAAGEISAVEWQTKPGLEPVWYFDLGLLKLFAEAERVFPSRPF